MLKEKTEMKRTRIFFNKVEAEIYARIVYGIIKEEMDITFKVPRYIVTFSNEVTK